MVGMYPERCSVQDSNLYRERHYCCYRVDWKQKEWGMIQKDISDGDLEMVWCGTQHSWQHQWSIHTILPEIGWRIFFSRKSLQLITYADLHWTLLELYCTCSRDYETMHMHGCTCSHHCDNMMGVLRNHLGIRVHSLCLGNFIWSYFLLCPVV